MFWKDLRNTHFNEAVDDLIKLWDEDQLVECVIKTRELLDNPNLPRYHRMRALILLGATLADLDDCQACYEEAESIWRLVKYWNPEGQDKDVDEVLAGLRRSLNSLSYALDAEENHSNEARTQLNPFEALDAGVASDYQYIDELAVNEATKTELRRRFGGYMDVAVTIARKVLTGATTLHASDIPGMTSKNRICTGFSAQGALAIGQEAKDVEPGQAQKDKRKRAMPQRGDSTTRPRPSTASSDNSQLSGARALPKRERK